MMMMMMIVLIVGVMVSATVNVDYRLIIALFVSGLLLVACAIFLILQHIRYVRPKQPSGQLTLNSALMSRWLCLLSI